MSREEKITTLQQKAKKVKLLEIKKKALEDEIENLKNAIKAEMGDTEKMIVGPYTILYGWKTSHTLDSKAIKAAFPEQVLSAYIRENTYRSLIIN